MKDVRLARLAALQHNRFSRRQLLALGFDDDGIRHRLELGRWVRIHEGVYAIAPPLDSDHARWTAATLSDEGGFLTHASGGAAWGWWDRPRAVEIVTRHGDGGPRLQDGLLVHRSRTLAGDTTEVEGLPVTKVPRTLLDLAPHVSQKALQRATREALRLGTTTPAEIVDALTTRHRGRRGSARLALAVARYTDLPAHRCRSGAELQALVVLRDAGREIPGVNLRIAGEEADLVWRGARVIVEIDGGQFHLDRGEDARKQAVWEAAGWDVRRVPSDDVFFRPFVLLDAAPG